MLTLEPVINTARSKTPSMAKHLPNAFLSALLIFAILNFVLYRIDSRHVIVDKTRNAHYFDFPTVRKLCIDKRNNAPNEIILLGSSLFNQPFWALDKAKNSTNCPDARHYHSAIYLSNKLHKLGYPRNIRSLAIGGAMISDYYLLLNKRLASIKYRPDWIIVDCAPRAFFDSGLVSGKDTPIFDYLFDEKDFIRTGNYYLPSFLDQIEFFIQHYCFFTKHRRCLNDSFASTTHKIFAHPNHIQSLTSAPTIPIQLVPNQKVVDSLNEYRRHYSGISTTAIQNQMKYLSLIADLCNMRQVKALFINMPLTRENKNLLAPEFYEYYRNAIKNAVLRNHEYIYFLDLDNGNNFSNLDFEDSAHLNEYGAKKLQDQISNVLTKLDT